MQTTAVTIPAHVPPELIVHGEVPGQRPGSDPYQQLLDLHDGPPLVYLSPCRTAPSGGWIVSRATDTRTVMQAPKLFSSKGITSFAAAVGEDWATIPIELDPPEHAKYRAPLAPIFAFQRTADLERVVRSRAQTLIAAFKDQGTCEFKTAFADPFPITIFMDIMGLPHEDFAQLVEWEHDLLHALSVEQRQRGAGGFLVYLRALIADRKAHPRDDLASRIAHAEVDGRPFTDDEVIGVYFLLVAAGLDTVAASLGLYFRHLALDPALQARLRSDQSLIPRAVEELLRRYTISTTSRTVTSDTELAGIALKAGDRLIMPTGAPSLDPQAYADPMTVDIDRASDRHFAFSFGAHHCLGAHLARRELAIAMEEMFDAIPPFRIADGQDSKIVPGTLLGVDRVPLAWN